VICLPAASHAAIILSTDFTGRTVSDNSASTSGIETITFDTPLILTSGESYEVVILAEGVGPGNNTGLDGLTLNGVFPEPASLAMMGLGGLMMLRRRRSCLQP